MDHDIREGDVCKIYFGGATDSGTGEAELKVSSVGDTVTGDAVRQVVKAPNGYRVSLSDSTWRIDPDEIHAVHHYCRDGDYSVVG